MHVILHNHISSTFRLILSHHQGQNIRRNNTYMNIQLHGDDFINISMYMSYRGHIPSIYYTFY